MMMIFGKANVCRRVQEDGEEEIFFNHSVLLLYYYIGALDLSQRVAQAPYLYMYIKNLNFSLNDFPCSSLWSE